MITERSIMSEIDYVAFDAWYGPDETILKTDDRYGQGRLMIKNIKTIIEAKYGINLKSAPSFHYSQIIAGIPCDISYAAGVTERLIMKMGNRSLFVEADEGSNLIKNGHVAYASESESSQDTTRGLRMGHAMIGNLQRLISGNSY
jgi:hypothetical protein